MIKPWVMQNNASLLSYGLEVKNNYIVFKRMSLKYSPQQIYFEV